MWFYDVVLYDYMIHDVVLYEYMIHDVVLYDIYDTYDVVL